MKSPSLPRMLRIVSIQKLTSISLALIPFLNADVATAETEKAPPGIEIRQAVSTLPHERSESASGNQAWLKCEMEDCNRRIAAFNREVLSLQKLEKEIHDITTLDRLENGTVLRKNAKINEYNNRARILHGRQALIEQDRSALERVMERSQQT